MASNNTNEETNLSKELVSKFQQFLSHQIESNTELSETAKESLTVATECIEQAFGIQKKPASKELLDIYRAHKQSAANPLGAAAAAAATALGGSDPAQLIQNLASTFLTQVAGGGSPASQQTPQQPIPTPQQANEQAHQQTTQSQQQNTPNEAPQPAPPSAPKERRQATQAEKLAAESFKNQGNDLMRQEKFKSAYDCYTQAIEIDNNNAIYYSNRAAASSKLNDHQAALRDCQEAIEIDPLYSKAHGRMGLAYASLQNHQKAKEAYQKAVELDPENESYRNNLLIAEQKLQEAAGGAAAGAAAGANPGGPAGPGGANMAGMLRSMMSNPEVMNMAMRSLQDPRMQSFFGGLLGAGGGGGGGAPQAPGGGGGGGATGGANQHQWSERRALPL